MYFIKLPRTLLISNISVYTSLNTCQAGSPIYSQGLAVTDICVSLQYAKTSIFISSCILGWFAFSISFFVSLTN